MFNVQKSEVNHFKHSGVKWLHFSVQGHTGLTHLITFFDIHALWSSVMGATRMPECWKIS